MAEYTLTPTQSESFRTVSDVRDADGAETETCTEELDDGGICGRERPCRYHD